VNSYEPLGAFRNFAVRTRRVVAPLLVAFVVACSSDGDEPSPDAGTGAAPGSSSGGTTATGGTRASGGSSGGTSASGGTAGSGGSSAGGASGAAPSGGTSSTGGQSAASGGVAGGPATGGADAGSEPLPTSAFVYVSGANGGQGVIALYTLDYASRALTLVKKVNAGTNASFLAIDVPRRSLYVADEGGMRVRQLGLDANTWVPSPVTDRATNGNAVYVATTRDGQFVLTAQYNEGKAESFNVVNGTLGISLGAQTTGGQAHAVVLSPDERFLFVPCKAADHIERYPFDKSTGRFQGTPVLTQTAAGAGPRHLAFHPNGRFAYLVNELGSSVYAYSYTADDGKLTELQRTSSLPDGFSGSSAAAEIFVSPSGEHVYASNRVTGQNGSLAAYDVGTDGKLTLVAHQSTGGNTPRSFAIDPTERLVIAANQDSSNVAVLPIDASTGKLGPPAVMDVGMSPNFVGIVTPP
jgi:6-phosphogluconolactonase